MTSGPSPKICGSLASKFSTIPFSLAFESHDAMKRRSGNGS